MTPRDEDSNHPTAESRQGWPQVLGDLEREVSTWRLTTSGNDVDAILAAVHSPEQRAREQGLYRRLLPVVLEMADAYLAGDEQQRAEIRAMFMEHRALAPYASKGIYDGLDAFLDTSDHAQLERALALVAALGLAVDARDILRALQAFQRDASARGHELHEVFRRAAAWCENDDAPMSARSSLLGLTDEDDEDDEDDEAWAARMERESAFGDGN